MVEIETNATHPAAFLNHSVAAPHQSRQNIGSEMPIFHRDSFPPGEAKGNKPFAFHNQRTTLSRKLRVAKLATPRWRCKTAGAYHSPTTLPQLRRYRALITVQLFTCVISAQVNYQRQRQQNQRNGKCHVNLALLTGVHIQCHGQCCRRSPQRLDKAVQL